MADVKETPATEPVSPGGGTVAIDPHLAAILSPEELKARQALLDDWSQYVALADIPYGNVFAYRAGDAVPASNVRRWKYDEQGFVAKRTSREGKAALEALAARSGQPKAPGD